MVSNQETPDAHLVGDVLSGRREAFSALVRRYLPAVHALAFAQTGNHTDADDVTQETFLKAYRSLHTLRDTRKFGGWLAAIGKNKARSLVRQRQRRAEVSLPSDSAAAAPDIEARELRELLKHQVELLAEPQRDVLLLHYFAGMTAREIGQLTGISKYAVQKRLQRARDT